MTIEQDKEILEALTAARNQMTREYFYGGPKVKLCCPVCSDRCESWENPLKREKLIYCRRCATAFVISMYKGELIECQTSQQEHLSVPPVGTQSSTATLRPL